MLEFVHSWHFKLWLIVMFNCLYSRLFEREAAVSLSFVSLIKFVRWKKYQFIAFQHDRFCLSEDESRQVQL